MQDETPEASYAPPSVTPERDLSDTGPYTLPALPEFYQTMTEAEQNAFDKALTAMMWRVGGRDSLSPTDLSREIRGLHRKRKRWTGWTIGKRTASLVDAVVRNETTHDGLRAILEDLVSRRSDVIATGDDLPLRRYRLTW